MWEDLDLPLPRTQGYSYTIPTVIRRTSFSDGSRWLRPPPGGLRRQFTVTYDLTIDELRRMMNFLHEQGFGESATGVQDWWIRVPLVSGETVDGSPTDHTVRVIADPKIQRIDGANDFLVELQFEDEGPPSFISWPPS